MAKTKMSSVTPISRRFLARAGLLPLLGGVSACSSLGEAPPDAGLLLVSISAPRTAHFHGYHFLYKNKTDEPNSLKHGARSFGYSDANWGSKPDFEESEKTGAVIHQRLAPGDYDIFSFSVPKAAPFANVYFRPIHPFSIPFTIRPYATTYLGHFEAREIPGDRFLGFPQAQGVYFVVSDQGDRDIPIAQKRNAIVGAVRKEVPDPVFLYTPLFQAP